MLKRCMKAFIDRDIETAKRICNEDKVIDALRPDIQYLIFLMIETRSS